MRESVRLGCWAAFWGDTSTAVDQILDGSEVDYLVSDYLSEITMALLARARQRDPEAGFVPDAVRVIAPRLAEIRSRGIKVITNAGALNPVACAPGVPRRGRGGRGDAARRRDRGRRPDARSSTRSATPERPTCSPASRCRTRR